MRQKKNKNKNKKIENFLKLKKNHFIPFSEDVIQSQTEVPRGVQNSKVRKQDKLRRDWSRH